MITTLLPLLCIICHASGLFLNDLPHYQRRAVTEEEQCERISQAMDALWEALPDDVDFSDIIGDEGNLKVVLDREYASAAKYFGFVTPSYTIATHEGRKELACKLAGVHSASDYLALYEDSDTSVEPYRERWAWVQSHGLTMLHDADKLFDILYYFIRITGFPHFPLDIYDADMANYMVDRLLEYKDILKMLARGMRTAPKEEWVNALTDETQDQLFDLLNIHGVDDNREKATRKVVATVKIYSAVPELIHLAEVIIEGGFFSRIEK